MLLTTFTADIPLERTLDKKHFDITGQKCTCRFLWFIAFAAAIILFAGQVGNRVAVFFEYKTNVAVTVKYVKQIEFPSVTICNQNNCR